MPSHKWELIKPLSDDDRKIDLAATTPLYETWRNAKVGLQKSSSAGLNEFTRRLVRRLSIETGILERIYDLDRGTTEALIANGFAEELVSGSSTDLEPSRLIDILRDQEAAVQLVMDCVTDSRALSIGFIHELHAILTKHQDTTHAVNPLGNRLEIPLQKGKFKDQPNNPKRPDGTVHEYCPPLHVQSEMDNLLGWFDSYGDEDPIIVASWFHHRLTQIHPYQDGNGRVARALVTLILLRSDLLPLVIDRDLRTEYVKALEGADSGNLTLLASLFARLQRSAILQALSIDTDAEVTRERKLTAAVLENLAAKFARRREVKDTELRRVNDLALGLRQRTRRFLENYFNQLSRSVKQIAIAKINMAEGGPDYDNAHWYKYEVGESATDAGKFANFEENHYFLKATIRIERERLIFVTSFHHVGRDLSGIMEATAFSQLESYEGSDDRKYVSRDFVLCSLEPFVFTYKTDEDEIEATFDLWLDAAVAVALKEYGDRL